MQKRGSCATLLFGYQFLHTLIQILVSVLYHTYAWLSSVAHKILVVNTESSLGDFQKLASDTSLWKVHVPRFCIMSGVPSNCNLSGIPYICMLYRYTSILYLLPSTAIYLIIVVYTPTLVYLILACSSNFRYFKSSNHGCSHNKRRSEGARTSIDVGSIFSLPGWQNQG